MFGPPRPLCEEKVKAGRHGNFSVADKGRGVRVTGSRTGEEGATLKTMRQCAQRGLG